MWLYYIIFIVLLGQGVWTAYIPPYSRDSDLLDEINLNSVGSEIEDNSILSFPSSDTRDTGIPPWQMYLGGGGFGDNLGHPRISPSINDNKIRGSKSPAKRFPIHLDPLLPPKYWMRTGECPRTPDGAREFFCPTPTTNGRWVCVDDHQLCDGVKNCPNADDESPLVCMFYKAMQSQISFVANGIISKQQAEEENDGIHKWRNIKSNEK